MHAIIIMAVVGALIGAAFAKAPPPVQIRKCPGCGRSLLPFRGTYCGFCGTDLEGVPVTTVQRYDPMRTFARRTLLWTGIIIGGVFILMLIVLSGTPSYH
jgi:hypothetical protein